MVKVHVYIGRQRFNEYLDTIRQVEGGTLSPGGAASMLRCSRQFIHKLLKQGKLEAWLYYEEGHKRPDYGEIAVRDLEAYAAKYGRGEPEEFSQTVDTTLPSVLG